MASTEPLRLEIASGSDVGRVRSANEDHCAVFDDPTGRRLLVVADGMGGHRGGATASRLAVEAIGRHFERDAAASVAPADRLAEAIRQANREVHAASRHDAELRGMGTTVVALLVDPEGAWVAHVGDSRAYLVRDDRLEALTEDHSVVAELMRRGLLTPDEAEVHPRRNEILRSVGVDETVEAELRRIELAPGDRIVLCSDGLCGVVSDEEILDLARDGSAERAVAALIEAANAAGGPDNVTVQVVRVAAAAADPADTTDAGDAEAEALPPQRAHAADTPPQAPAGSRTALALIALSLAGLLAFSLLLWR